MPEKIELEVIPQELDLLHVDGHIFQLRKRVNKHGVRILEWEYEPQFVDQPNIQRDLNGYEYVLVRKFDYGYMFGIRMAWNEWELES